MLHNYVRQFYNLLYTSIKQIHPCIFGYNGAVQHLIRPPRGGQTILTWDFPPWFCLSQRRLEARAEEVMAALNRVGDVRDIRQRARVSYIRFVCLPTQGASMQNSGKSKIFSQHPYPISSLSGQLRRIESLRNVLTL